MSIKTSTRFAALPPEPPADDSEGQGALKRRRILRGLAFVPAAGFLTACGTETAAEQEKGSSAGQAMSDGHQATRTSGGVDLGGTPGKDWKPYDATLKPAPKAKSHKITITVVEKTAEIAPGVKQPVWTFNGTLPGPTIRGKVGDDFEITLINDGRNPHGIDFHASWLAPDKPMRVIPPGERLTQRWTAKHSGIWLYHCSAPPILHHMANGQYGAVIIDPPNLPEVDREFCVVQSELFFGKQGADPKKLRAGEWDAVVFNGYPNQYMHKPLQAKVGERVRIWTLAAGPIGGMSFHVVGTQFDEVFHEGAYLLKRGNAERGGSQAINLGTCQGGFVEMVFPEKGHYVMVDHDFRRADNGCKGIIEVT